jgi:hypothetical protein
LQKPLVEQNVAFCVPNDAFGATREPPRHQARQGRMEMGLVFPLTPGGSWRLGGPLLSVRVLHSAERCGHPVRKSGPRYGNATRLALPLALASTARERKPCGLRLG